MDKEDIKTFHKAKLLANLSYLGLLFPLAGWILGGISRSLISSIPEPKTILNQHRLQHVKNVAAGGLILSTLMVMAAGAFGAWVGREMAKEAQDRQATEQAAQLEVQRQQQAAEWAEQTRRSQLETCLNDVEEWYKQNATGYHPNEYWTTITNLRQQQVNECQIRYQ